MEWTTLMGLLPLLFGQVGVLGTILIVSNGVTFWLLRQEQAEHAETRRKGDDVNEKRLELATKTLEALLQFRHALEVLNESVNRTRRNVSKRDSGA